ncbi:MAG: glutaredoxin-like protein NrdH [Actinomycetaceae bacterium]|nr:glutaredoxin-like protein NrdH [Actinomycetaceae bacterium]
MSVTVYSKEMCMQCNATKRALKKQGIAYTEVFLDKDTTALDYVKSLGYSSAPVVIAGASHWSGFRPDKIKTLTNTERTLSHV